MKNQLCRVFTILLIGSLVLAGSPLFACSGGNSGGSSSGNSEGGNESLIGSDSQPTGVKSNGPAYAGATMTPSQLTRKWNNIKKMNEAQRHLNHFQNVEDFGDFRTLQTQVGFFAYGLSIKKFILIPFSAFWQVPKHASRTAWGYTTGKLDTVEEVNKRSWIGRQVNHYLIQHIK